MGIRVVKAVYYSAVGNTKSLVEDLGKALAEELSVPMEVYDFTLPGGLEAPLSMGPEDFVVLGAPVYAGKLPNKLMPYIRDEIHGDKTPALTVVTFGNRSFDNALAEMREYLKNNGFIIHGAGAFVMPHVFSKTIAANRPDEGDMEKRRQLVRGVLESLGKGRKESVEVPGDFDAPYYTPLGEDLKPAKFLKAKVKTTEDCNNCGICVELCPMGSIEKEDPKVITGPCIKCQACVVKCPQGAKYFDDASFLSHVAMLEKTYQRPAKTEIFLR